MFELRIGCDDKEMGESDQQRKEAKKEPRRQNANSLELIRRVLEGVGEMVTECEISATADGISIQIMDTMQVGFADIFFGKSSFDLYRCDRDLTIGVKLKELIKIFRSFKSEGLKMFKLYCDDDAKRLFMDYEGSGYTLSFNLTLFQFNSEKYHFPDIEYSATLEMPSSDFLLIPKIVGTFGEFISIDAKKETAEFMQEGDLVCASFTIDPSKDSTSIITVSEPVKITIPMKYVNVVAKIVGLSEKLKISMGDHAPALFEFGLDEDGYMKFYVALKINDSDE